MDTKRSVFTLEMAENHGLYLITVYIAYPMKAETRPFPLNAWYAAAYDVEVSHALLARTICNQKLVLYRRTDGEIAALEDACWHRLMPLSLGRLEGDEVVCGYHGLVYNSQGRCTFMPSQETLNPSACVRAYPVVEKHRFVWVWPGDPAKADLALVPDMHWNDDPEWARTQAEGLSVSWLGMKVQRPWLL